MWEFLKTRHRFKAQGSFLPSFLFVDCKRESVRDQNGRCPGSKKHKTSNMFPAGAFRTIPLGQGFVSSEHGSFGFRLEEAVCVNI